MIKKRRAGRVKGPDETGRFGPVDFARYGKLTIMSSNVGRARPLSLYGDVPTTLQVWSPDAPKKTGEGLDHTRAVMAIHDERERRLIELEYGAAGELLSARSEMVRLDDLAPEALARAKVGAENIRRRRIAQAHASGKIGRNEACPCGSGRKYKRCCRP